MIAVKISPFSDPLGLESLARVLLESSLVKIVAAVNTFPNALLYDKGTPAITPADGRGGMAGPALLGIGLGHVMTLRRIFGDIKGIIGIGGVRSGADVQSYRRAGADAVGVATEFVRTENLGVFHDIVSEILALSEIPSLA